MYVKVPAIGGVPQVGRARVVVGISLSAAEAIAIIDGEVQNGWTLLTEADYLALGGFIPQLPAKQDRVANLEQVIDALLTGGGD
jgi:hypothetical protein